MAASTVQRPSPESETSPWKFVQRRVLCQRGRRQIEQPRRDHAAAAPDFRTIADVDIEPLVLRDLLRRLVLDDVEAFRVGLHDPVFDAVMYHLDEMPGAGWSAMHVALDHTLVAAGFAFRRLADVALSGRQCAEDWIETIDGSLVAADHHAVAAFKSPNAAGRSDVNVGEYLSPAAWPPCGCRPYRTSCRRR